MAINCHTYDLVIHGSHLPKGATASIDGGNMINMVKRKLRDFVEEKIPFLRRRREDAQKQAREAELKYNHACLTMEDKNGLILEFKRLIHMVGRERTDELFSEDAFYTTTITYEEVFEEVFTREEYDVRMAKIKDATMNSKTLRVKTE